MIAAAAAADRGRFWTMPCRWHEDLSRGESGARGGIRPRRQRQRRQDRADAARRGMGFGWCEVGFSGVTFPAGGALPRACRENWAIGGWWCFPRISCSRGFSSTGSTAHRTAVAAAHPGIEFRKGAGFIWGIIPRFLATFAERGLTELVGEVPARPTARCAKYRTQVLGFEAEVGAVQGEPPSPCRGAGGERAGLQCGRVRALRGVLHGAVPVAGAGQAEAPSPWA